MKRKTGRFRPIEIRHAAQEPWARLGELIDAGTAEDILAFLTSLPPGETGRALSRLSDADQTRLLILLKPHDAADVLETLPRAQAAALIEELAPDRAASIVDVLPSAQQADLLAELDEEEAEAILHQLRQEQASTVRRLLRYPPDTAGGLMIPDYLAYPATFTVQDLLADVRANADRYTDFEIQYVYITEHGRLVGVLRLRDLLLAPPDRKLGDMMIADPLRVRDDTPLEQLKRFFDEHTFYGIPAVDAEDHLLGVVRRAAVEKALRERRLG
jgi:magnesium transporter